MKRKSKNSEVCHLALEKLKVIIFETFEPYCCAVKYRNVFRHWILTDKSAALKDIGRNFNATLNLSFA